MPVALPVDLTGAYGAVASVSPDGRRYAVAVIKDGRSGVTIIDTATGATVGTTPMDYGIESLTWADSDVIAVRNSQLSVIDGQSALLKSQFWAPVALSGGGGSASLVSRSGRSTAYLLPGCSGQQQPKACGEDPHVTELSLPRASMLRTNPAQPGNPAQPSARVRTTSATVTWTAPQATGVGPVTRYDVVAIPGGTSCTVSGSGRQCSIRGLRPRTQYTFTVRARNLAGWGLASSVSGTTAVKPAAPPRVPPPTVTAPPPPPIPAKPAQVLY